MHKHYVIHIDDDPDDLELVRDTFTKVAGEHSIELFSARDGKQGIELIKKVVDQGITPCIILLDINMPVMNGKETLVEIKKTPQLKDLSITLFTTSDNELDKLFAKKQGVNFVTKPLSVDVLRKLVTEFVFSCKSH